MKIAYICNEVSQRNGWSVINYYTVKQAVDFGHEVLAITDSRAENVSIPGVQYHPCLFSIGKIRSNKWQSIKGLLRVQRLLSAEKPDVIHVLVEPYLIYFAFLRHPKLFLTIVGTYSVSIFEKSFLKSLYRFALQRVFKIVSISHYTTKRFRQLVDATSDIKVIPMGVDFDVFKLDPSKPAPSRELAFCFVGHIKPRKGLIYALKALARVKKTNPTVKFYVAGLFDDPGYSEHCKSFIREQNLTDNVIFLGRLPHSEIKNIYARCIMNLLPSYNSKDGSFEGFGLIHLEANAASTLTLGSKETGNESAILNGETGFLVTQEDDEELALKMQQAIDLYQREEYSQYAQKCIEHARQSSWEKYFATLEKIYLEADR